MNIEAKPAKHSAPGQYLGFALQPVRAFYHLLTAEKGAKVSLEFLDDVAVHYADGTLCLEQTKSALKQNPISDWANDLWKALDNWLTMLKAGECEAGKTRFRLYVVPQKKGDFARALSLAGTPNEVATVIATVRRKLAKLKEAPACIGYLQPLLDATEEQQAAIIANFELESDAPEPLEAIRARLRPAVPENVIDLLCRSGIGQAKQAFDRLIERGETPMLDADTFKQAYGAFLRQNLMSGFLPALSEAPSEELVTDIMSTRPIFIRQLELVEASNDDQLRAVGDFLRASADKAEWADHGFIFPGSLDEWDDSLVHRHSLVRGDIANLHDTKPPEVQGRLAYRSCAGHQAPLEGRVVPGHFVHGSFNDLADRLRLGWHPEYEKLLSDEVA